MTRAAALLVTVALGAAPASATDLRGKGPRATECFAVLRSDGDRIATAPNRLECTDGDPGCDVDGDCHNQSCTFRVRVCINQDVPGCAAPAALTSIKANPPKLRLSVPATLAGAACGDPTDVVVPLRGKQKTKPGKQVIVLKARAAGAKGVDADKDTLVCLPRAVSEPCPTTTTTVAATTTTSIAYTKTTTAASTTTTTESTSTTGATTTASTTTTTMAGGTCAPLVDDAEGIAGTYQPVLFTD